MIVACVRTGAKYGTDYVYRLKAAVGRHLQQPHRFVCLTDRPSDLPDVETVDIARHRLEGWFGKMVLFEPAWRTGERVLYFDLDMAICCDLSPLAALDTEFGICANFTKRFGFKNFACNYGSCVMTIGPDAMAHVWDEFSDDAKRWVGMAGPYGDQWIIEKIAPAATLLQDVMPKGYFIGYRELTDTQPPGCAIVAFGGRSKPHNCTEDWIARAWTL